jgi:hypothetical protein
LFVLLCEGVLLIEKACASGLKRQFVAHSGLFRGGAIKP